MAYSSVHSDEYDTDFCSSSESGSSKYSFVPRAKPAPATYYFPGETPFDDKIIPDVQEETPRLLDPLAYGPDYEIPDTLPQRPFMVETPGHQYGVPNNILVIYEGKRDGHYAYRKWPHYEADQSYAGPAVNDDEPLDFHTLEDRYHSNREDFDWYHRISSAERTDDWCNAVIHNFFVPPRTLDQLPDPNTELPGARPPSVVAEGIRSVELTARDSGRNPADPYELSKLMRWKMGNGRKANGVFSYLAPVLKYPITGGSEAVGPCQAYWNLVADCHRVQKLNYRAMPQQLPLRWRPRSPSLKPIESLPCTSEERREGAHLPVEPSICAIVEKPQDRDQSDDEEIRSLSTVGSVPSSKNRLPDGCSGFPQWEKYLPPHMQKSLQESYIEAFEKHFEEKYKHSLEEDIGARLKNFLENHLEKLERKMKHAVEKNLEMKISALVEDRFQERIKASVEKQFEEKIQRDLEKKLERKIKTALEVQYEDKFQKSVNELTGIMHKRMTAMEATIREEMTADIDKKILLEVDRRLEALGAADLQRNHASLKPSELMLLEMTNKPLVAIEELSPSPGQYSSVYMMVPGPEQNQHPPHPITGENPKIREHQVAEGPLLHHPMPLRHSIPKVLSQSVPGISSGIQKSGEVEKARRKRKSDGYNADDKKQPKHTDPWKPSTKPSAFRQKPSAIKPSQPVELSILDIEDPIETQRGLARFPVLQPTSLGSQATSFPENPDSSVRGYDRFDPLRTIPRSGQTAGLISITRPFDRAIEIYVPPAMYRASTVSSTSTKQFDPDPEQKSWTTILAEAFLPVST
ncbi:hypothetical protein AA313_de0210004 [Arthrobotrys entomopaga]|nr:hypothetical protein AA313_de0210004 [Arthrobotrys entomopaga]